MTSGNIALMARRRRQFDPAQMQLPNFSREDRLAAIDATNPQSVGIQPRAWRSVRELLRQIEFCSRPDCHARVEVLAARMGVTGRTVRRVRDLAERAGLLIVTKRPGRSHLWQVRWSALSSPAEMSAPPDTMSAHIEFLENQRNPTTSTADAPCAEAPTADPHSWEEVEEDLLRCGVRSAPWLIDTLRQQGVRPHHARAIVNHWQSHPDRWSEGALVRRLQRLRPGQDPATLWPPPSAEAQARENRRRRTERLKARRSADEDLTDRHRATLAAMTPAERFDLAQSRYPILARARKAARSPLELSRILEERHAQAADRKIHAGS